MRENRTKEIFPSSWITTVIELRSWHAARCVAGVRMNEC